MSTITRVRWQPQELEQLLKYLHHLGKVPECLVGLLVTVRSRGGRECIGYAQAEKYSD